MGRRIDGTRYRGSEEKKSRGGEEECEEGNWGKERKIMEGEWRRGSAEEGVNKIVLKDVNGCMSPRSGYSRSITIIRIIQSFRKMEKG